MFATGRNTCLEGPVLIILLGLPLAKTPLLVLVTGCAVAAGGTYDVPGPEATADVGLPLFGEVLGLAVPIFGVNLGGVGRVVPVTDGVPPISKEPGVPVTTGGLVEDVVGVLKPVAGVPPLAALVCGCFELNVAGCGTVTATGVVVVTTPAVVDGALVLVVVVNGG